MPECPTPWQVVKGILEDPEFVQIHDANDWRVAVVPASEGDRIVTAVNAHVTIRKSIAALPDSLTWEDLETARDGVNAALDIIDEILDRKE